MYQAFCVCSTIVSSHEIDEEDWYYNFSSSSVSLASSDYESPTLRGYVRRIRNLEEEVARLQAENRDLRHENLNL